MKTILFDKVRELIEELDITLISDERKAVLQPLSDFVQHKKEANQLININFICTHNSRRSHLSQIWAQVMASYFKVDRVFCYSGGTEATALFPMVAQVLRTQGLAITALSEETNPVYSIKFATNAHPIIGFSKKYDDDFNPLSDFAAIMTCSNADVGCPFIPGAEKRIPITFDDPKAFDGTPLQEAKYLERSVQIATELKFVFSQIK